MVRGSLAGPQVILMKVWPLSDSFKVRCSSEEDSGVGRFRCCRIQFQNWSSYNSSIKDYGRLHDNKYEVNGRVKPTNVYVKIHRQERVIYTNRDLSAST